MNEKRISLRFQTDNELDMKAWELLEKATNEKKVSKNSIMIELIISALENENSDDALAEQIAELVVAKLGGGSMQRKQQGETTLQLRKALMQKQSWNPRQTNLRSWVRMPSVFSICLARHQYDAISRIYMVPKWCHHREKRQGIAKCG